MRLIDADKLIEVFEEYDMYLWKLPKKENPHRDAFRSQLNWCINTIRDQPTISNDKNRIFAERILLDMSKKEKLEKALLWVIHEQCVYGNKAYAKLLIHGQEAFDALNLKDECDVSEIESRLFKESNVSHH